METGIEHRLRTGLRTSAEAVTVTDDLLWCHPRGQRHDDRLTRHHPQDGAGTRKVVTGEGQPPLTSRPGLMSSRVGRDGVDRALVPAVEGELWSGARWRPTSCPTRQLTFASWWPSSVPSERQPGGDEEHRSPRGQEGSQQLLDGGAGDVGGHGGHCGSYSSWRRNQLPAPSLRPRGARSSHSLYVAPSTSPSPRRRRCRTVVLLDPHPGQLERPAGHTRRGDG